MALLDLNFYILFHSAKEMDWINQGLLQFRPGTAEMTTQ